MEFRIVPEAIIVSLPITTPTGKVRVKRPRAGFAAEPIAGRSVPIERSDFLEWQISYDTDNLHEPSVLRQVIVQKPQGVVRYGCELLRLIVETRRLGLLAETVWADLRTLVNTPLSAGIEELDLIERRSASLPASPAASFGFTRHVQMVPNYAL